MIRKISLSLLVIGAVVALVGGVTFALFSDNIASDEQKFSAGTVDIVVYADDIKYDETFQTDLDMEKMEPGDCSDDEIMVKNEGTLDVNLWNWIYTWGDIFSCDPNPACCMSVKKTLIADSDGTPDHIASGGSETYKLTACLPLCAGNGCQGDSGTMRLFFHAVQDSNLEGYECVKLEDKASPDWIPDPTTPAHGNLCYKAVDTGTDGKTDALHVVVNGYGLAPNACFQLDLTGGDTGDPYDPGCQTQDSLLAGISADLYTAGYWNWGSNLEATCNAGNGGEGVWNYAGVYEANKVCSDASGAISYEGTLTALPMGTYHLKAHVKEITSPWPGTGWTTRLSEMDYLQFTLQE
jgi:predicted ribosomally synthesized peptide with SipW-like signal peptide